MAPDAPVLHEHVFTKGVEPRPRAPSNVCSRTVITRGDVTRALDGAAATARMSVQVDTDHQGYLEPQVVVAQVDASGFATVWASTQGQFTAELMIARMLGMPQSQLRVVPLASAAASAARSPSTARRSPCGWRRSAAARSSWCSAREEVLQGGSGPTRRRADRHCRRRRQGWPARRHRGHLSHGCRRAAGFSPSLRHAGVRRSLSVPQSRPAGLRRRHQQAAHRGLSRARRHPGGVRHGAGHGRAVPAVAAWTRSSSASAMHRSPAAPCRSARRSRHRPDHHPGSGRRAPLLDRAAARGPLPARPRAGARLLARHVDDLGRPHHHRRRRPPDGDDGRCRSLRHAHHHGAGGGGGVRAAHRRRPHPHGRHQVGRLQRRRRRQPRGAHDDGGAGRGQPRRAGPACARAAEKLQCAPERARLRPRRLPLAPGRRPGHHRWPS